MEEKDPVPADQRPTVEKYTPSVQQSGPLEETTTSKQYKMDEVDALRRDLVCRWYDIIFLMISIITYVGDLATDGFVAGTYYQSGDYFYFGLTLAFMILPSTIMSVISCRWYMRDHGHPATVNTEDEKVSLARWVARILCLVFLISPIIRYAESLHYGLLSRKSKSQRNKQKAAHYYARMALEDADASFLRLFESYLESAPQLVLQLYIMARNAKTEQEEPWTLILLQAASVITSVVSLAWSLTSYNRTLRYTQSDKRNIRFGSAVVLFLSHLFIIVSRVLPLSLFASIYGWFIWPVCGAHWMFMSIWLILQKTAACTTKTEEILFDIVIGIVHVFTFFSVKSGSTRNRYVFYYTFCFVENSILMFLWFHAVVGAEQQLWFYYPALGGQFTSFMMGLLLLLIYHKCFHPNVHPRVAMCTKDDVCASALQSNHLNNQNPPRLGRFDVVHNPPDNTLS